MKVAFVSLGCAKNLVNTEQMMALCRSAGYTVTGEPKGADVAVVNTCGFIDSAKSEAIDTILSIAPLKNAGKLKKLLVTGCFSQRYPEDIRAELPEVAVLLEQQLEAAGFVVIPFWDADFAEARYCMARTVSRGRVRNKEWRPKGVASPLWNEWMLSAGLAAVYVAEGLLDAMALAKMLDKPCMALGGTGGAGRFASVLAHTPRDARPGCVVVCMDEDEPGRATAARIAGDLDRLGIAHAFLPPYPGGAKDADEWLMAERGGAWEFEFAERFPGDDRPLARTRWIDGG